MEDKNKSKEQLLHELEELRRRISELEVSEARHKGVEERYRSIFDDAVIGIFQVSPEGRFLDVNPAAARILGYESPEDFIRRNTNILTHVYAFEEDRNRILKLMREQGFIRNFEVRCRHRNGNIVWVSVYARFVRDQAGTIIYHEGTVEEITSRKQTEETLNKSRDELESRVKERTRQLQSAYDSLAQNEKLYRNLFENSSIGMFQSRLDGSGFLRINKSYAAMLGYETPEEMMSKITDTATQVHTDPKNRHRLLAGVEKDDWYYAEQPFLRKDGSIMTAKLAVRKVLNRDGTAAYLEGIVEDITERRRTEDALRENEKQYRDLIENAPFPAVISSPRNNRVFYINQRAAELFKVTAEDAVGEYAPDYYDKPEQREVLLEGMKKSGSVKDLQVCLKNSKGERFWALLSATRTVFNGQEAIFASFNNISERIQFEEELKNKTLELEEVNTALRVLIGQREGDKGELEERMFHNVKQLVLPYVEKLKQQRLGNEQSTYVDVLESNLMSILEPFTQKLLYMHKNLTPAEVKVANLIREGKTAKEIASIFGVSEAAINRHRQHIRNKLGLNNEKVNLRTHLLSIK